MRIQSAFPFLLLGIGGILGALAVLLAAITTHLYADNSLLFKAWLFLLLHAGVFIALGAWFMGALTKNNLSWLSYSVFGLSLTLFLGILLFCGDLTAHVVLRTSLFPFAAPIGGFLLILSWLGLGFSGIYSFLQSLKS